MSFLSYLLTDGLGDFDAVLDVPFLLTDGLFTPGQPVVPVDILPAARTRFSSMQRATGLASGWRVISSTSWKTSGTVRPIASPACQPVSRSATGFR